mgnify:CR=1 FL=1
MCKNRLLVAVMVISLACWGLIALEAAEYKPDEVTVALWHFNEGSGGIFADTSGNGNDGTITNAGWSANGKYGACLDFSVGNDVDQVPDADSLDFGSEDSFTIEAWVKFPNTGTEQRIVTKGWGPYIGLSMFADGSFAGGLYGPNIDGISGWPNPWVISPGGYNDNQWHHVAFIRDRDAGKIKLYVDEQLKSENVDVTGDLSNGWTVAIGAHHSGGSPAKGLIDEVRISRVNRKDRVGLLEDRIAVLEATLTAGVGLTKSEVQAMIDTSLDYDPLTGKDAIDTIAEIEEAISKPGASGISRYGK